MDENNPSKKLSSVICDLSVIVLQINLYTDKALKNKLYPLHSAGIFIAENNISPTQ